MDKLVKNLKNFKFKTYYENSFCTFQNKSTFRPKNENAFWRLAGCGTALIGSMPELP